MPSTHSWPPPSHTDPPFLEFPFVPTVPAWSTNQDRKMNQYERHRNVKEWKGAARMAWKTLVPYETRAALLADTGYLPPTVVQVVVPFSQQRKRDPHNYCGTVLKAIVDGLVEEQLWPDDTPDWVGHREPRTVVGTRGWIIMFRMP